MIRYEGLRDVLLAFRELDREAYAAVSEGLHEVGEVVREDATRRFDKYDRKSAAGFEARVRPGAESAVIVGQKLRKTTGLRPDWGALQVTRALLPARTAKLEEAGLLLEARVGATLRAHGL